MLELFTAKTFTIIALQLSISWLVCYGVVIFLRQLLVKGSWDGVKDVQVHYDDEDKNIIDLEVDLSRIKLILFGSLVLAISSFSGLFFIDARNMSIAIPLLLSWSIFTALFFALCFINIDENFTTRLTGVLALSAILFALRSYYNIADLAFITSSFVVILAIIASTLAVWLLVKMSSHTQRMVTVAISMIFMLYIFSDFNDLVEHVKYYNDWSIAITYCINIYLDFLFLLLDIVIALVDVAAES